MESPNSQKQNLSDTVLSGISKKSVHKMFLSPLCQNSINSIIYINFSMYMHYMFKVLNIFLAFLLTQLFPIYVRNIHLGFPCRTLLLLLLSRFSRVRLCVTLQMAAYQAPLSLGFPRQEQWSGFPFPSPMHESEK